MIVKCAVCKNVVDTNKEGHHFFDKDQICINCFDAWYRGDMRSNRELEAVKKEAAKQEAKESKKVEREKLKELKAQSKRVMRVIKKNELSVDVKTCKKIKRDPVCKKA